ncbi:DUF2399 domain-containing protein [Paraburkholderia rhizosphaerae]|uniref:Uncharacterized protein DUF2399 n=1 Tax=Paraburkholderia rhizosphaerae TaxID=480658 RepID=A0A4R8L4U4_9BURK|nr:DUF2399 domain-containing protein [Paraburkholderia rhizosphaerae]TDY37008.1 uncharacterized protein DUF2399 [Paraburkholderia rhizosphaerae]
MTNWVDIERKRGMRDRCASGPAPDTLPLLDPDYRALLQRWVRSDGARRSRASLLNDAGPTAIERADGLCDRLLQEGWIVRRERLTGGTWQWDAIVWRDLPRLQSLLAVSSPRQRGEQRKTLIEQGTAWLLSRSEATYGSEVDPDLLDELARALVRLDEDKTSRLDVLKTRIELLQAIAAWHDAGAQGTRRDFALQARGTTKAISDADWRWLDSAFDLERLRITPFAPLAWLAGDISFSWAGRQVHLGPLQFAGLPLTDLRRADAASLPNRWWLIENRASFERQARTCESGVGIVWMPGRPSFAWLEVIAHLLTLAPAPAYISADADPAGVDIACSVGAVWQARGLKWQPYQMGASEWAGARQHWPLNEHDRALLARLQERVDLPADLRELCDAMLREGRKAEQEGWV